VILVGFFAFRPWKAFWIWFNDRECMHLPNASAAEPPTLRQALMRI